MQEFDDQDYQDLMQFLETTLYEELQRKGKSLIFSSSVIHCVYPEEEALEHYEQAVALDQAEIDAAVQEMYGDSPQTDHLAAASTQSEVLCPHCKSNWLLQTDGGRVFLCHCGFRLNMQHDGITSEFLQSRLAEGFQQHRSKCAQDPQFQVQNRFGAEVLCIQCSSCAHFEIIV